MSALTLLRRAEEWLNEDETRTVTIRTIGEIPCTRVRYIMSTNNSVIIARYPNNPRVTILVDPEKVVAVVCTEEPKKGEEL